MVQYASPIFDTSVISVNFWHIQNASWQALVYMQCIMGKLNVYTSTKKEVKCTQIKLKGLHIGSTKSEEKFFIYK